MTDVQDTQRLRPARLAGFEGHGILTVMRGADGHIIDTLGTWRFDNELDTSANNTLHVGQQVTYQGAIADSEPDNPKIEEAKLNVIITDITEREYLDGQPRTLVSFTSHEHRS